MTNGLSGGDDDDDNDDDDDYNDHDWTSPQHPPKSRLGYQALEADWQGTRESERHSWRLICRYVNLMWADLYLIRLSDVVSCMISIGTVPGS